MTPKKVFDTSALMAYALDEPGAGAVWAHIRGGGCVMHEVNVSEFCFSMSRKRPDEYTPEKALDGLIRLGVVPVGGFNLEWARQVATVRLSAMSLNFGDGLAVVLAASLGIALLTAEKAFREAKKFADIELIR